MLLYRLKTQSRTILLPTACLGLLFTHSDDFLVLSPSLKIFSHLLGFLLFLFVLWNACQLALSTKVERKRTTADAWSDGATAITGIALLLCNRFAHMTHPLHGLSDIAGWTLILFCWFSPTSRWQAISISSFYLIVLSGAHWTRNLSDFEGANTYVLIALLVLWLSMSALTYFFLSRRNPAPAPLNYKAPNSPHA